MKKNLIFTFFAIVLATQVCAQNVLSSSYNNATVNYSYTNSNEFTPYWDLSWEGLSFGFLKGGEKIGEIMSVGANRYISENTYIGARIGYSMVDINNTERDGYSYITSKAKLRFIIIPVELGYILINTDDGFKLGAFTGIGINYCVKAESSGSYTLYGERYEYDNDPDLKGKVGLDGKIGVRCYYKYLGISASYVLPLNKKQDLFTGEDGYFKVGLCFAF